MENIGIKVFELEEFIPVIRLSDKDEESSFEIIEEIELRKQFSEDMEREVYENISEEKLVHLVKRYKRIVDKCKEKCEYKCQICGHNFLMDNGKYYCEAHHVVPISEDGSQNPENVLILCANHHRMFHYAKEKIHIEDEIDKRVVHIDNRSYCIDKIR